MKKIFFIILLFTAYSSKSQILSDSVRPSNCHHDGAIFFDVIAGSNVENWLFDDDSLGWIIADTMLAVQVFSDSIITQQCGSYKVIVDGDTSLPFPFVGCPLGIIPDQDRNKLLDMGVVEVFGPGTSSKEILKFVKNIFGSDKN